MIDYIKKQDAINELMDYASKWFAYDLYNKIVAKIFQDVEFIIKSIPSADVIKLKRSEWVETSEGTMCSNCHKFPYDDGEYHIANWYSNFCPHCGAEMRG